MTALEIGRDKKYPVLVYGCDAAADTVWIADRAGVPLTVTTAELAAARARVKKDKFRLLTLGNPDPRKLVSAVHKGIWDTLRLYTDRPPKGSPDNFGFAAYKRWAELLTRPKVKNSWASVFPPGRPMVAGLTSAFYGTVQNGEDNGAERNTYACFLEEASPILNKPGLLEAAGRFREAAQAWEALGCALLPDEIPALQQIRQLMLERKMLFYERGGGARPEIAQINARIRELKGETAANFPWQSGELEAFLDHLRSMVLKVHGVEQQAIQALQGVMVETPRSGSAFLVVQPPCPLYCTGRIFPVV